MTEDQATTVIGQGVQMLTLLGQIQFCTQCTAVAACFCFGAQLWRLVLQAKNAKNVV
jgi:hypothetical protein